MDLSRFPRRIYTNAPTPIERLPHFTKALAASCPGGVGPEIWIKRDDMLGLFDWTPKFVRRYGDLRGEISRAVAGYAEDVRARKFPGPAEIYFAKAG